MKTRPLGLSGLQVSEICLGTMTWGTQNTQAEAFEQMDYALSVGVNFWDTAEMYPTNPVKADTMGHTESIIGQYFAQHPSARAKVVLASKITGPGRYKLREESNITPTSLSQALEASLQRLQTDYLDLYQLHWPNRGSYHFGQQWHYAGPHSTILNQTTAKVEADMLATLEALAGFIKAGKIRHWGLSNDTAWGTMKMLELAKTHGLPKPVSLQNEYSLLCRLFEPDLAEVCLREGVGLLAWSPLAGGLLTQKYHQGARPAGARATLAGYSGLHRSTNAMQAAADAYRNLAAQHGLDAAQLAIAFTLAMPFTASSIIGATTPAQLQTNIAASQVTLEPEVLTEIAKIYQQYPMPY
jgi:aryl-alcohol dehydrogenase-like predicted oxidoreductase